MFETPQLYKNISITAFFTAIALFFMLMISILNNGVTAQSFELVQDIETFTSEILAAETPLRWIMTFDNIFLTLYTTTIILLAIALKNDKNVWLIGIATAAVIFTGYLDLHENHDILTMVNAAKFGLPITSEHLLNRMIWSQLKFHSSYLGFFLFSFALPGDTFLEKLLRWSLWTVYLPLGVLVYTFPNTAWDLGRYAFMLSGFVFLGLIFQRRARLAV